MQQSALLRLLLACFFLYMAWPYYPHAHMGIEFGFWMSWIVFCLLVIGANLAQLMRMTERKVYGSDEQVEHRSRNY